MMSANIVRASSEARKEVYQMDENRDKIDNEMSKNKETKENEQKINNDCNCGCEHCGPDGCSEEDCKECDNDCSCKDKNENKDANENVGASTASPETEKDDGGSHRRLQRDCRGVY